MKFFTYCKTGRCGLLGIGQLTLFWGGAKTRLSVAIGHKELINIPARA